jgi:allophanate hydrolase subunit 2
VLPVGVPAGDPAPVDAVRTRRSTRELRLRLGPREEWFETASVKALAGSSYVVGSESNRIGLRLEGTKIRWRDTEELPSEGMVLGAVQVPPNGQPVVFLNDHPTTGGYPVIGVVVAEDLALCAQLRPGDEVTLRVV